MYGSGSIKIFFSWTFAKKSAFMNLKPLAANRFATLECCEGSFSPSLVDEELLRLDFGFKSFISSVDPVPTIKSFSSLTITKQLGKCEWVFISTPARSLSKTIPPIFSTICFTLSCVRVCLFQVPRRPSRQNLNPAKTFSLAPIASFGIVISLRQISRYSGPGTWIFIAVAALWSKLITLIGLVFETVMLFSPGYHWQGSFLSPSIQLPFLGISWTKMRIRERVDPYDKFSLRHASFLFGSHD